MHKHLRMRAKHGIAVGRGSKSDMQSEECRDRLNATGETNKKTDKREQEESERLTRVTVLPSLFSPQLVVLVISQLCFSSHILMLTYF